MTGGGKEGDWRAARGQVCATEGLPVLAELGEGGPTHDCSRALGTARWAWANLDMGPPLLLVTSARAHELGQKRGSVERERFELAGLWGLEGSGKRAVGEREWLSPQAQLRLGAWKPRHGMWRSSNGLATSLQLLL